MKTHMHARTVRGFTLVEAMVVVALVVILMTMAAPSFTEMLARKRLEGVVAELGTDVQYARSEAGARNTNVTLTANAAASCYTIFADAIPAAGSCNCADTPVCTGGPTALKTVSFADSSVVLAADAVLKFDAVRGMLDPVADVNVNVSKGAAQMRVAVTRVGRVATCSPSATVKGYPTC